MGQSRLPSWAGGALVAGALGALWLMERRRPLRRAVEPQGVRDARNLGVAAAAAVALALTEKPVADRLTALVERRRWGLVKRLPLPAWLETLAAVVLLDYTLYLWHVLTHRVPWLWRFHVVHHADLDLSATTALRFHFGELVASVPWRAAQILVIGVSPAAFSVWQTALLVSVIFHHSNARLPERWERRLNYLLVTPRMHGIHHSLVPEETNSNWSSGLTLWDRLHGTLRLDVPQQEITIGLPDYRDPSELGLAEIIRLPFGEGRPAHLRSPQSLAP
jgi:sterol desaturase/sphingolipid hydroxylase (fatty acid hydroxylase superfamily)